LLPGDGIGPAVVDAAVPVLDAAAAAHGLDVETTRFDRGTRRYLDTGAMMPEDGVARLASFDAILFGAVGHPDVPDHISLDGLIRIIVTVHRWIAETGGRSTGTDLQ
jgi:tartrate dehydrogenase/decarboxylase/D-malate dehydrogenase